MPPRPHGLIFDLDGTLVDTVADRIDGWIEALEAVGVAASREQVAPRIGMDGRRLAREMAALVGRRLSEAEVEATDRAAGAAFDRRNVRPRPLPGVYPALVSIEAAGIPWVIATSSRKEQVTASVAALGLARPPVVVDGSHVQHAKPAPDLLLLAGQRLGIEPVSCWAVGDSTWDMRATVAAGMTAIGVTSGSAVSAEALVEAGAAKVIATLADLGGLVTQAAGG